MTPQQTLYKYITDNYATTLINAYNVVCMNKIEIYLHKTHLTIYEYTLKRPNMTHIPYEDPNLFQKLKNHIENPE